MKSGGVENIYEELICSENNRSLKISKNDWYEIQ